MSLKKRGNEHQQGREGTTSPTSMEGKNLDGGTSLRKEGGGRRKITGRTLTLRAEIATGGRKKQNLEAN